MLESWRQFTGDDAEDWLLPCESAGPLRRDNAWDRYIPPKLKPLGLDG